MESKIFINLSKGFGQLDMGKLIRKPVQVHGQNGKVFTRYQWVSPDQASTGNGVRKISSQDDMKQAFQQGIGEHPDFDAALKHQGVDLAEHDFKNHPHFFLPETKESAEQGKDLKGIHFPHGSSVDHKVYSDKDVGNVGKLNIPASGIEPQKGNTQGVKEDAPAYEKYAGDPKISKVLASLNSLQVDPSEYIGTKYQDVLSRVGQHATELYASVGEHIQSDDKAEPFTKEVQMRNLQLLQVNTSGLPMIHPTVAHAAVDKLLGKERAEQCRELLKRANLTINCDPDVVDDILTNGYTASTLSDYAEKNLRGDSYSEYQEIMSKGLDTRSIIREMDKKLHTLESSEAETWGNIASRLEAEFYKVGLTVNDPKPCYVALNPLGTSDGGCTYYGDAHVIINKDILHNCTATTNDNFVEGVSNVPKIHDMDHLADMFILRQAKNGLDMKDPFKWVRARYSTDIRMELQYHKPKIDTKYITLGARELED